jgi:hypothetical protein
MLKHYISKQQWEKVLEFMVENLFLFIKLKNIFINLFLKYRDI